MKKDYFNVSFNKLIFKTEALENSTILEFTDDLRILLRQMDEFKEECLGELFKDSDNDDYMNVGEKDYEKKI